VERQRAAVQVAAELYERVEAAMGRAEAAEAGRVAVLSEMGELRATLTRQTGDAQQRAVELEAAEARTAGDDNLKVRESAPQLPSSLFVRPPSPVWR
jgi:hypothetical protein